MGKIQVGESYKYCEGGTIFIKEEHNGKFLGKDEDPSKKYPWATYDEKGKCQDLGGNGIRLWHWDLILEETVVPWTKETIPLGIYVKEKYHKGVRVGTQVSEIVSTGVGLGKVYRTFESLAKDYLTIDDQPCGRKV